jgi:hypothetical protein
MDMRDYPTLHLDTSKGTACSHLHPYPFLLQAVPLLVSKCNDMDVNEHERLSSITRRYN